MATGRPHTRPSLSPSPHRSGRKARPVYFYTVYVAYLLGLITTIVVMHTFQAAQV